MFSTEPLLESLRAMAQDATFVALLWHLIVLSVLVCLFIGWRTSRRNAALGMTLGVMSSGAVALLNGAWTLAGPLLALALVMTPLATRLPNDRPVRAGSAWTSIAGGLMLAVGCFYPALLTEESAWVWLVTAPLGVVPGATLAAVLGFTLIADGLRSRAWSLLLATVGALYGLFGTFVLGLFTDLSLVFGSAVLAVHALTRMPTLAIKPPARRGEVGGRAQIV